MPTRSLAGCPSRLLGFDVGLGVLTIGHSPAPLHQFVIEAHGAHEALSDRAAVSVYNSLLTRHRLVGDQIIQLGGGLLAEVIQQIQAGGMTTLVGIAAELSRRQIRTSRGSTVWQARQVHRLLNRKPLDPVEPIPYSLGIGHNRVATTTL